METGNQKTENSGNRELGIGSRGRSGARIPVYFLGAIFFGLLALLCTLTPDTWHLTPSVSADSYSYTRHPVFAAISDSPTVTITTATATTAPTPTRGRNFRASAMGFRHGGGKLWHLHGAGEDELRRHKLSHAGQRGFRDGNHEHLECLDAAGAGAHYQRYDQRGEQLGGVGIWRAHGVRVRLLELWHFGAGNDFGSLQVRSTDFTDFTD